MASINLAKVKTYSLSGRKSKVKKEDFARICTKGRSFAGFYAALPDILAARDFKELVRAITAAHSKSKSVMFLLGAHVIKCGLSPLIIDLLNKKIITQIALNGAGVVHDVEIAMMGRTSEDVASALQDGSFGMAKETADFINDAVKKSASKDLGMGTGIGIEIAKSRLPYKNLSILYAANKRAVPVTVHVAIGADIVHQHPSCDGASLGKASLKDFHIFIEGITRLGNGGVVLNIGSAVVLPEVFLKALNVARNLGYEVKNFTAANFDMVPQYRPYQNVVRRPTMAGGKGISIIGHHEILIPLLHAALVERI